MRSKNTELSPRHSVTPLYYKEGNLIEDAKSFTLEANKFHTNMMDNKSLILKSIYKKNIKDTYNKMMDRHEFIGKYYNQDFREAYSSTMNTSGNQTRRDTENYVKQLERSLERERDKSNEIFINDEQD